MEAPIDLKYPMPYVESGHRRLEYDGMPRRSWRLWREFSRIRSFVSVGRRFQRRAVTIHDARHVATDYAVQGFAQLPVPARFRELDDPSADPAYAVMLEGCVRELHPEVVALEFTFALRGRGTSRRPVFDAPHLDFVPGPEGLSDQRRFAYRREGLELVAILGTWHPIGTPRPVVDAPLCLLDASTLADRDIVPIERARRRGEEAPSKRWHGAFVRHAPRHRWYYYPKMTTSELLIFRHYTDAARPFANVHTSIISRAPRDPADTRRSCEGRVYLYAPTDSAATAAT